MANITAVRCGNSKQNKVGGGSLNVPEKLTQKSGTVCATPGHFLTPVPFSAPSQVLILFSVVGDTFNAFLRFCDFILFMIMFPGNEYSQILLDL